MVIQVKDMPKSISRYNYRRVESSGGEPDFQFEQSYRNNTIKGGKKGLRIVNRHENVMEMMQYKRQTDDMSWTAKPLKKKGNGKVGK